jgi:hypothetical protein
MVDSNKDDNTLAKNADELYSKGEFVKALSIY